MGLNEMIAYHWLYELLFRMMWKFMWIQTAEQLFTPSISDPRDFGGLIFSLYFLLEDELFLGERIESMFNYYPGIPERDDEQQFAWWCLSWWLTFGMICWSFHMRWTDILDVNHCDGGFIFKYFREPARYKGELKPKNINILRKSVHFRLNGNKLLAFLQK